MLKNYLGHGEVKRIVHINQQNTDIWTKREIVSLKSILICIKHPLKIRLLWKHRDAPWLVLEKFIKFVQWS